jgi:predicted nucleic acid-binding protein
LITYVDASVLLRVIQGTVGSLPSWRDVDPVSSVLIRVECLRVIDRARARHGGDDLTSAAHRSAVLETLNTFSLAPITDSVLERASDPFPTALSTLDAIHLATALQLRELEPHLEFATHDQELAIAAQAVGFTVTGV